jgi:Late embryogenesis abundant protein
VPRGTSPAGSRRRLLPVIAVSLAACSTPAPPTVTAESVSLTRLDAAGVALRMELDATNPNASDVSVSAVTSRILIDEAHEVGRVTVPETMTLAAGKTTKVDVSVSMGWTDVGFLAQLAFTGKDVPYSVDGTLALGGSLLHVGVPFHMQGRISHDQLMNLAVNSLPSVSPR